METRVEADPLAIIGYCDRAVAAIDSGDLLTARSLMLQMRASARVVIALQDAGPSLALPWEDGIAWTGSDR